MITELFALASGLSNDAIRDAIPPACRGPMDGPASIVAAGAEILVESPAWRPRLRARHLLPALSVLAPRPCVFRLEVSVHDGHRWSAWIGGAVLGGASFTPIADRCAELRCDIDVFTAALPLDAVRVRARLPRTEAAAVLAAPWLVTLSACDLEGGVGDGRAAAGSTTRLAVPAMSQMTAAPEIARRICSPTSVAMALAYWGVAAPLEVLAAEIRHRELDLYGIWPAAVAAAARRGVLGYLLRFPDWDTAAWCLAQGVPVIASISYKAGALAGAPMESSEGHLVVLTGWDGGDVLVNDPAAPTAAEVPRRYRRDELLAVWLERAGVGYVLFRPPSGPGSSQSLAS